MDRRYTSGSGRKAYLAQLEEGLKQQTDPEQLQTGGSRLAPLQAYWQMRPSFQRAEQRLAANLNPLRTRMAAV